MDIIRAANIGTFAMTTGIAGTAMAAASHAASNNAEGGGANTGPVTTVATKLGLPLVAVGALIATPGAARGGPFPAALLGAIGIGTSLGIVASAFD